MLIEAVFVDRLPVEDILFAPGRRIATGFFVARGREAMGQAGGDRDDKDLRARLDALTGGLERQRASSAVEASNAAGSEAGRSGRALSVGVRVVSEFVAAVVVGAIIGWQVDEWFGTQPGGLIAFLLLGMVTGFWNVYRIAVALQRGAGSAEA